MRAYDDTVSRLQSEKRFEYSRRGGVCCGNNRADKTDRLGDFPDSVCLVLFQNSAGFYVSVSIVNIFGRIVVFDNLVLDDAHARLFDGEFCKRNTRFVCGKRGCKEDFINLFLRVGRIDFLCGSHSRDCFFKRFNAVCFFV